MNLRTLVLLSSVAAIALASGRSASALPIDSTTAILEDVAAEIEADETGGASGPDLRDEATRIDDPSRGLSRLEAGELLRARRRALGPRAEEILHELAASAAASAAGVREEPVAPAAGRRDRAAPNGERAPNPNLTLQMLARALVNMADAPIIGSAADVRRRNAVTTGESGGISVLATIMNVAIDPELVEAISQTLQPSIGRDGVVTFSAFGLRDIAVFISPSADNIRIIDLTGGRSISMRFGQPAAADVHANAGQPGAPGEHAQQYSSVEGMTMADIIRAIQRVVNVYIINPFTLIIGSLVALFWVVFRLASRAA